MRLTKMKLSGFKSFVDPTTIPLPSNLIGIVGPNGCGKSNTIDAVRWVMGESSAKHLRGDSMADVIFNGSSSRKPVGQASVELVFDNTDGSLGGEYAQYNEISIKRVVSRDGQSSYYLNGTRCRRRDITDIFLGTGLGPRSYAIIEQGTISRIIEAKPEEMRVFLEEAAGISKYKERRRETENRIRHTRDNLDRLNDLRDELEKQLSRLQRQAKTAERYKVLREEERIAKGQLQALRWQQLNSQSAETETRIREQETALEQTVARQRGIEAEIEKQRSQHTESTDNFNKVQSRFYSVGADIARLEQSIQHAKERRQKQQEDMRQLEKDWQEAEQHVAIDRNKQETAQRGLQEIEPQLAGAEETSQASSQALAQAEQLMHEWQVAWEDFNRQANEPSQQAEVERTRIQHLEQKLEQLQQRLQRAEQELAQQSPQNLESAMGELKQKLAETEATIQAQQDNLQQQQARIAELRDTTHRVNAELDEARSELQDMRGRSASLEALQQAALGKEQGAVTQWLNNQHLQDAPRLAEELNVESGWEHAVECVLGDYLEAVCVSGVDPLADVLGDFEKGTLTLFDTSVSEGFSSGGTEHLISKVTAPYQLDSLLNGIYAVESLADALQMRANLAPNESVVTKDGLWLGNNWLRVIKDDDEKAGVLQREQELKQLASDIEAGGLRVAQLQQQLEEAREQQKSLEAQREDTQRELNQLNRALSDQKSEIGSLSGRMEQIKARQQGLQKEIEEAQAEIESDNAELKNTRGRLQEALDQMSGLETQREELIRQRDEQREALDKAREQARQDRDAAHEIKIKVQTLRTELTSAQQALQRVETQLEQLSSRRDELQAALADSDAPIETMSKELETMLEQRVQVESELNQARAALQEIEHTMRELEESRGAAEQAVLDVRSQLEEIRVGWQETKVRRQTLEEQVTEAGFTLQTLIAEMPEEANEEAWQSMVEELERKINRLGPINLAAIEEFEQQSERKQYLDKQNEDLMEALKTLEDAIAKIDKETRTRFKETFDKVNGGMKQLFPRLFGGGHAYLEMTGDDILDAGVTVMARPPGKRNSTIHLLSGGEKALTAVALVFSIFELNPAPFCMLDEVDAPLDDANVGRYSEMVKEMSARTQFIFITHNKVTMEIADHLAGVTMHEPGVSRLVAVDVDEAAAMVAG
ncbi:MAG: chromosome segregation protein SMC [Thioalkalispiraceae bacterium]